MLITSITHRGWPAFLLSNPLIEAIVVPAIGRVMALRRVGGENVLWEDLALDGSSASVDAEGWNNYGGDKVWPSPQDRWEALTARAWPPPEAFDSRPYDCEVSGCELVLRSTVDPQYGIQALRRILLAPNRPVMTIATTFRKLAGEPVHTGIWVITQARDPERIFALLPERPSMASGFLQQMGPAPKDFGIHGRLLELSRDPFEKIKLGTEGLSLLWVGEQTMLRIDAPERPGEYPDGGSRTEVYTNSDPLPYVELETLGPLATLHPGQEMEWTNTYTLTQRTGETPREEARRAFGS
jgi:hypothetical protein